MKPKGTCPWRHFYRVGISSEEISLDQHVKWLCNQNWPKVSGRPWMVFSDGISSSSQQGRIVHLSRDSAKMILSSHVLCMKCRNFNLYQRVLSIVDYLFHPFSRFPLCSMRRDSRTRSIDAVTLDRRVYRRLSGGGPDTGSWTLRSFCWSP